MRHAVLVLCLALIAFLTSGAGASPISALGPDLPREAEARLDYLVITNAELAHDFAPLLQEKKERGLFTGIATVEAIQRRFPGGRDLPESIRMFLQWALAEWDVRFVLLGGDVDVVPARMVPIQLPPNEGFQAVDLYYAALDGDWDADGDGIFGEHPEDEADLEAELAIGRAPVSTPDEVRIFVNKTIAFQGSSSPPYRDAVLLLCENIGGFAGEQYGEDIVDVLAAAPLSPGVERLYENYPSYPGSLPLDRTAALDALEAGDEGLIVHVGFGLCDRLGVGAEENELYAEDLDALENGERAYVFTAYVNVAEFDQECLTENLLLNPDGGAVAVLAHSGLVFPQPSHQVHRLFLEEAYAAQDVCLGSAVLRARTESLGFPQTWRTAYTLTLLGDPELRISPESIGGRSRAGADPVGMDGTRISLTNGLRASRTMSLFDVAGRRVRTLEMKGRAVSWDRRDDAGRRVAPGVYFLRGPRGEGGVRKVTVLP